MLRKLIKRVVVITISINSVAVLALAVMGYLATLEPSYYVALRNQEFSQTDHMALEANFKLLERELSHWTHSSIERQRSQVGDLSGEAPQGGRDYDPANDVKSVEVTQDQLNTVFSLSTSTQKGDWRNPRIRLGEDRLDFAFELAAEEFYLVLSAELQPSLMPDGRVRLDLISARIGKLRLPVQTVLSWLPLEPSYREDNLEFRLTEATPHVLVTPPDVGENSPSVKSLKCVDGKLLVELLPPVVEVEQQMALEEMPLELWVVD